MTRALVSTVLALALAGCSEPPASRSPSGSSAVDSNRPPVIAPATRPPAPAAEPPCVHDPPGPCEMRHFSPDQAEPFVYFYKYEGRLLVEEHSGRGALSQSAPVRSEGGHRYTYDERGHLVLDEALSGGVRTWVGRYRRDAHGNVLELRSRLGDGPERVERHVLELDRAGRVRRDERWALPDAVDFGPPPSKRRIQRMHWTIYDRDARGDVRVESEEDERGPSRTIYLDRDEHGGVTHTRTVWRRSGATTETRVRHRYDACGNDVETEALEPNGTVSTRWLRRYRCD